MLFSESLGTCWGIFTGILPRAVHPTRGVRGKKRSLSCGHIKSNVLGLSTIQSAVPRYADCHDCSAVRVRKVIMRIEPLPSCSAVQLFEGSCVGSPTSTTLGTGCWVDSAVACYYVELLCCAETVGVWQMQGFPVEELYDIVRKRLEEVTSEEASSSGDQGISLAVVLHTRLAS